MTWSNAARVLGWCIGLWCVMLLGVVLAGFICGFVAHDRQQRPVTVVKYVDHAPRPQ